MIGFRSIQRFRYFHFGLLWLLSMQFGIGQNTYSAQFNLASLDTTTAQACYDLQLSNTGLESWVLSGFNINIFYDASVGTFLSDSVVSSPHVSESDPRNVVPPSGTIVNSGLTYDSIGYLRVNVSDKIIGEGQVINNDSAWVSIIQICFELSLTDITDPNTCFTMNFDNQQIRDASGARPDIIQEAGVNGGVPQNLVLETRSDVIPDRTYNSCFVLDEDNEDLCSDGIDNDEDGLIDCMDTSCGPGMITVSRTAIECFNPLGSLTLLGGNDDLMYSIDGGMTFSPDNNFLDLEAGLYDIVVTKNGINSCVFTNPQILQAPECNESEEGDCSDGIDNDGDGFIDCEDDSCLPRLDSIIAMVPFNCPFPDNGSIEILTVFPNVEYSIDSGQTFIADPIFTDLEEGAYYVMIRNMNTLCAVEYDQNPFILTQDTICIIPDEVCIDGIDNDFDGLIDCADEDCQGQASCVDIPDIYIPNIISIGNPPNDQMKIESGQIVLFRSVNIYDRWGNQVYKANNFSSTDNEAWDGTYKNNEARSGVYVYHIEVDIEGTIIDLVGDVTVIN